MNVQLSSKIWNRYYSTMKNFLPAKAIRNRFLEFFVNENEHHFIKSSPVASAFDPTIPFVNAGMCQFKRVFTGEEEIDCTKAANTQKCIRIGGKHNDLNLVGIDSYHHTFFEMLGNWSFGAYCKKEACKLAWELITSSPYSISPSRLFVTYFGGDEKLNLPADEEVKNIWLELGISPDRILPFGVKENFWEMGLSGPCGTCTEIHVALTDEFCSKSEIVNKGHPLLSELWNIVFIKYNKSGGSIKALSKEYVDTGMGFERLTTVLQGKTSNYDTDLFLPLFDKITELTNAPKYKGSFEVDCLDVSYRTLADFSRMITVAVTDNIFPDINCKLRRILRKALYIAKYDFNYQYSQHLMHELSALIAEQFQEIFPEIGNNLEQVNQVISHENKLVEDMASAKESSWKIAKSRFPELKSFSFIEYPGLPNAFLYLKNKLSSSSDIRDTLSANVVYYLYDTYGLDQPVIERLSHKMNFRVDWNEVEEFFVNIKNRNRKLSATGAENFSKVLHSIGIQTEDIANYSYSPEENSDLDHRYVFPDLSAELIAIVDGNEIVSVKNNDRIHVVAKELESKINVPVNVSSHNRVGLIFDKSNLFSNCGNGSIHFVNGSEDISLDDVRVRRVNGIIVHYLPRCAGRKVDVILKPGIKAVLKQDAQKQLKSIRNHTISHLTLSIIQDLYPVSYLKNFIANDTISQTTVRVLGKKFDRLRDKSLIEERLTEYISRKLPINTCVVSSPSKLLSLPGVKLAPGEFYPTKDIKLVTVADENGKIISREVCGDHHLLNTSDIGEFKVVQLRVTPSSDLVIGIVTGPLLTKVHEEENLILSDAEKLENLVNATFCDETVTPQKVIQLCQEISTFVYRIAYKVRNENCESIRIRDCLNVMMESRKKINALLNKFPRASLSGILSEEIKRMKNEKQKCVAYFTLVDYHDLRQESFKVDIIYRNEFPTMFFSYSENKFVYGVAYVPENLVTDIFNAELWMKSVFQKHNDFFSIKEEDDMRNFCFMHRTILRYSRVYPFIESLVTTSYSVAQELIK